MQPLSDTGRRTIDEMAARHGIGADAAQTLLAALAAGGGSQAQFSHPELGGMGQWSQGGMIMIGDMFNGGLKQRIDGFLTELSAELGRGSIFAPAETGRRDGREGAGLFAPGGGGMQAAEWPADLGRAATSGAQNDLHYAYFPDSRRLAIRKGGHITVYDTADHAIGGVSQQQSGDQTLTFTSQHGAIRLADLRVVGEPKPEPEPKAESQEDAAPGRSTPQQAQSPAGARSSALAATSAPAAGDDVISLIERLAALRDRGILSDDEFAAKKAELLDRL